MNIHDIMINTHIILIIITSAIINTITIVFIAILIIILILILVLVLIIVITISIPIIRISIVKRVLNFKMQKRY